MSRFSSRRIWSRSCRHRFGTMPPLQVPVRRRPRGAREDALTLRGETGHSSLTWWFFFFLGSGFAGLVYEIVWLRLAMAAFGVTTPLVSIVLSVFMAGLALGSFGGGRLARRLETGTGAALPL